MAEIISNSVPQDIEFGWLELKNGEGQGYRVHAFEHNTTFAYSDCEMLAASGPEFDLSVNWKVGTEGAPSDDIRTQAAILWYKLDKAPSGSPYQYRLTIEADDTYCYTFIDNEPKCLSLDAFLYGRYSVDFNSSDPTISTIRGY
ncbi:hypothetical protein ACHAPO_008649 [Fusarium lateritium]